MSKLINTIGVGIVIVLLVFAVAENRTKQEFEREVEYYENIAFLRSDIVDLVYKEDAFDNFRGITRNIWKENRTALRNKFAKQVNNPFLYIRVQIDIKNRIIVVNHYIGEDHYIIGWYKAEIIPTSKYLTTW